MWNHNIYNTEIEVVHTSATCSTLTQKSDFKSGHGCNSHITKGMNNWVNVDKIKVFRDYQRLPGIAEKILHNCKIISEMGRWRIRGMK